MSDWLEIHKKIHKLQQTVSEKPADYTLDMMLSLLSLIVSSIETHEMECGLPHEKEMTKLRLDGLERRIGSSQGEQKFGSFRAIDAQFATVLQKLDAILTRLPEPPRDFGA